MNTKTAVILISAIALLIIVIAAFFQFSKPSEVSIPMTEPLQQDTQSLSTPPVQEVPQEQINQRDQELAPPTQMPPTQQQVVQEQAAATFDAAKKYSAILSTEKGDISIEFNTQQTPKTVENFVTLAKKKFYNGTIFHRAIKGFMIQGGDPKGDGTGGPGYQFDDEPFKGEYTRGTIAMANSGPNTNGSQFFIMHQDYPLPPNYVIFGRVTKGLEVVDAIATAPVAMSATGEQSKPVTPIKILSVSISEK
ncbi:MAG: peptidylprolyl isomerase [Patescibacteria group bacterium]